MLEAQQWGQDRIPSVSVELLTRSYAGSSAKWQQEAGHDAPDASENEPDRESFERGPPLHGDAHDGRRRTGHRVREKNGDGYREALCESAAGGKDRRAREKTDREHDEDPDNGVHDPNMIISGRAG